MVVANVAVADLIFLFVVFADFVVVVVVVFSVVVTPRTVKMLALLTKHVPV